MTTSANEGTSHTYSFTTTDPGTDSFMLDATECGTGGTQVGADTFNPTTGAGSFVCSFPDGPATPTVSVTVNDADAATGSDTVDVTVANVAPTVTLSGHRRPAVNEGTRPHLQLHRHRSRCRHVQRRGGQLRRQRHPGRHDTFDTATGAGSFVCSFPDGPATRPR